MDPMDNGFTPRVARGTAVTILAVTLLAAGCTGSDSGGDAAAPEDNQEQSQATAPPSPEPVRFTTLPEPCSLLGEDVVTEVVPKADPKSGDELSSSDVSTSGACLWTGLDDYDFRSLTVSLRRFESDPSIGSGDQRAENYRTRLVEEITGDTAANKDISEEQLADTGDAATSVSYQVSKETDGERDRYQQQRVVVRTGNVVVTVDYSGAGFEEADTPGAQGIKEDAETAAREAVAAVDASASAAGGNGDDASGN